jgi:hypothetical protein
MIALDDANGTCYVDPTAIQAISGPMVAKSNPESRKLILEGYVLYVLNSAENCKKLGITFERLDADAAPRRAKPVRRGWPRRGTPAQAE